MDNRYYPGVEVDAPRLMRELRDLFDEDYQVQTMQVAATSVMQARKESTLRDLTGMSSALTIKITPEHGGTRIEIGIMKAIGAEDREIKLIFFVEAGVIGLTGGIVGALLAWGIDAVANRLAYRFILQPQGASYVDFFALPPYLWLGAILFAVLVSIIAALYPAARAAKIDPVKALRHD